MRHVPRPARRRAVSQKSPGARCENGLYRRLPNPQRHILPSRQLHLMETSHFPKRGNRHIPGIDNLHLIIRILREHHRPVGRLADAEIMNGIIVAGGHAFADASPGTAHNLVEHSLPLLKEPSRNVL